MSCEHDDWYWLPDGKTAICRGCEAVADERRQIVGYLSLFCATCGEWSETKDWQREPPFPEDADEVDAYWTCPRCGAYSREKPASPLRTIRAPEEGA